MLLFAASNVTLYIYIKKKKTSEKVGLLLTLSLFGNFIVTPSNTGLLCF